MSSMVNSAFKTPAALRTAKILAAINFFVFVVAAIYLGGDALNGYAREGRYFLGQHVNGPFTEVSRAIYNYSFWHALGTIGSIVPLVLGELWLRTRRRS